MYRCRPILYALTVTLAVSGCARLEYRKAHFEGSWPAAAIRRIEIEGVNGTINVDAASPDNVRMSADVAARGVAPKKGEENDGYFHTRVVGDTLVIGQRRQHHVVIGIPFFTQDDVRIDYELHVPPNVALDLRTINGRIATRGMAGETSATTVNGEVDLEATGANEVAAKAINGRVDARFLHDFHGARLGTINGRVTAVLPSSASFVGDFSQVNGDFEAGFPLTIHSHPRSRRVSGEVNGGRYLLKISTVNGDIKVDNAPPVPPVPPRPAAPAAPASPAPRA